MKKLILQKDLRLVIQAFLKSWILHQLSIDLRFIAFIHTIAICTAVANEEDKCFHLFGLPNKCNTKVGNAFSLLELFKKVDYGALILQHDDSLCASGSLTVRTLATATKY